MSAPVTLSNCADEPIHIPGAIQPHGWLLALDQGRVVGWSENIAGLSPVPFASGLPLDAAGLPADIAFACGELLRDLAQAPEVPMSQRVDFQGHGLDLVAHRNEGLDFIELERRPADEAGTSLNSRAFERVKRAATIDQLLGVAVQEVRRWTGFDRVMAYVFRHDDSGDVVAEDRGEGIDSFLGMRYPASDIPAQARRLYTLSTLRLIPDIDYEPVPLLGAPAQRLDLSHSVLRSVSPIHIEYLRNMGIQASMSVSIVVAGKLWGLLACHHHSPLQVPHDVRQACDVLAQLVASGVQAIQSKESAARLAEGTQAVGEITRSLVGADDLLDTLATQQQDLLGILRAEALVLTQQSRIIATGGVSPAVAKAVAAHFATLREATAYDARDQWPEALRPLLDAWVGALGFCYDAGSGACVIALRREQVSTVRWAGQPEKQYAEGPNGPRLTPRGSFAEWKETVRGKSTPWRDFTVQLARQLHHELQRAVSARQREVEEARQNLIAALGHDLRDPLHSMSMIAGLLKVRDSDSRISQRLESTTGRMQRMVAQVLDFSRVEAGQGLAAQRKSVDLAGLLEDLVEEARIGHPGVGLALELQPGLYAQGDADRIAQAVGNLVSNARHHGDLGHDIAIALRAVDGGATVTVANVAAPIPDDVVSDLFTAYKRRKDSRGNRTGLGLGLYIASRIAQEHGGSLQYAHDGTHVRFNLFLPANGAVA